jgi:hypothetical protein
MCGLSFGVLHRSLKSVFYGISSGLTLVFANQYSRLACSLAQRKSMKEISPPGVPCLLAPAQGAVDPQELM